MKRVNFAKPLRIAIVCASLALFASFSVGASIIKTDIVFVQDVSGSLLSGSVPNIVSAIPDLAARFDALGVDASYGLVTFLGDRLMPYINTDLTDAAGLSAAYSDPLFARYVLDPTVNLTTNVPSPNEHRFRSTTGGENSYSAVGVALNGLTDLARQALVDTIFHPDGTVEVITETVSAGPQPDFISYRPDAIKNVVLLTDEAPQDGITLLRTGLAFQKANVIELALQENALLNIITNGLDRPRSNADVHYRPLADATGGNVFDLDILSSRDPLLVSGFIQDFAATKFNELADVCSSTPTTAGCENFTTSSAPEPGTWLLLGAGLLGIVLKRRC